MTNQSQSPWAKQLWENVSGRFWTGQSEDSWGNNHQVLFAKGQEKSYAETVEVLTVTAENTQKKQKKYFDIFIYLNMVSCMRTVWVCGP